MAIEATTSVAAEVTSAQPAAGTTATANAPAASTATVITPEQAERNAATKRAIEAERKAEKLEAQIKASDEAAKAKNGEFETLWKQEKARGDGLEQQHASALKQSALLFEAQKLGLVHPKFLQLAETSNLKIENGEVVGADAAAAAFFKSTPEAFARPVVEVKPEVKTNSAQTKPGATGVAALYDPSTGTASLWGNPALALSVRDGKP